MNVGAEPAVRLRDLRADDLPGALRLSQAAGWNQREDEWRLLLALNPRRFVAAVLDGRVVATGGASCFDDALAWLCMILVDPACRGRGLGRQVTAAVLDRLRGFASIGLDATPAGRPVYTRLGFVEQASLRRVFRAADAGVPQSPGPAARPLSLAELPAVLALDREVFGADRGDLLRWALAQAPALAWCVTEGGRPVAFCFGRPGHHSFQVGPIVAPSVAAARDLLAAALAGTAGRRVVVDAPEARTDWLDALRTLGFQDERPLTRMYRGAPPAAARDDRQLGIFGPEFG
jgi:GNAT superfamily N-acetyltransferase